MYFLWNICEILQGIHVSITNVTTGWRSLRVSTNNVTHFIGCPRYAISHKPLACCPSMGTVWLSTLDSRSVAVFPPPTAPPHPSTSAVFFWWSDNTSLDFTHMSPFHYFTVHMQVSESDTGLSFTYTSFNFTSLSTEFWTDAEIMADNLCRWNLMCMRSFKCTYVCYKLFSWLAYYTWLENTDTS